MRIIVLAVAATTISSVVVAAVSHGPRARTREAINGQFVEPTIAHADFNDGTTAPFTTASGSKQGGEFITVVNDPTGQFGGKVAAIRYTRSTRAGAPDVNRALRLVYRPGIGLGETVFLRGELLIPTPSADMLSAQRKLFYVQRQANDKSFFVLKLEGKARNGTAQPIKIEITRNRLFHAGTVTFGKKTALEVQITNNSAVGVADGSLRVWKDGELVLTRNQLEFLTTPAPFRRFLIGQQAQTSPVNRTVLFDELRYWDNPAISTRRIGP